MFDWYLTPKEYYDLTKIPDRLKRKVTYLDRIHYTHKEPLKI